MRWQSFRRALKGAGHDASGRIGLYLLGAANALLVPLLAVNLGLIVQLLIGGGASQHPRDPILGPIVAGRLFDWPLFGESDYCLAALSGVGIAMSLAFALTQWMFVRSATRDALRTVAVLRTAIHRQTLRLGPEDLLGAAPTRPERLFNEHCDLLARAIPVWRRGSIRHLCTLGALAAVAFILNPWLALLCALLAYGIWYLRFRVRSWAERSADYWRDRAKIHAVRLFDELHLTPLTASYGLPDTPGAAFTENLTRYHDELFRERTTSATSRGATLTAMLVAAMFLILAVGFNVLGDPPRMSVAGSVVLGIALASAYFPLSNLIRLPRILDEADKAAGEVFTYLDRTPGAGEAESAKPLERLRQAIEFSEVTLAERGGGRKLLDRVSFQLQAGAITALVASDRYTPLALASLLVRFRDPTAGHIRFDGREINAATLDTLRGQAILVSQRGSVFRGSVRDNIACGDHAFTTHQITEAARQSGAYDLVQNLPDGFATMIGDHELRLRPDQAMRISLARALLRNPSLLIVEEPHEDWDDDAARECDEAIQRAAAGRTLLTIPARLATLRAANRILLFHDGMLHAQGTHAELIQSNELYRQINFLRFNRNRQAIE